MDCEYEAMNGILYRDLNWGMMMIGFFVSFVTTVDPLICVFCHLVLVIKTLNPDQKPLPKADCSK